MADIRKITDFGASQLDIYARIPEVQLLRFHEPGPGIFIAESFRQSGKSVPGPDGSLCWKML